MLFDTRLARTGIARAIDQLLEVRRETRIIAFADERDEEFELALFLAGVRGLCPLDAAPAVLQQAVAAVVRGELWISRGLVPKLVDGLTAQRARPGDRGDGKVCDPDATGNRNRAPDQARVRATNGSRCSSRSPNERSRRI